MKLFKNCFQTIVQQKGLSAMSRWKQSQVLNKNMAILSLFWAHKKCVTEKEIVTTKFFPASVTL